MTCDASATHYGSVLTQIDNIGIERPIGYARKLLNEKEAKQQLGLRERASIIFSLRHWKPYLIGKEFTLQIDHKPNLAIARGKTQVNDSLCDEIMSYLTFKLEYINGKNMLADLLSRPIGFSAIIKPSSKSIPDILRAAHDNTGHMSVKYTLQNIENLFTWPNMRADVDNYVCSCKICLKVNSARPHTKEPLQKLRPPALQIGDRIHIDLVDMPKATSGHVAVCTIVDRATGYTILPPVLDRTSQSVSGKLLNHYIPYFSVPKVLVTDKGKENANSEIKKLTERYKSNISSRQPHILRAMAW